MLFSDEGIIVSQFYNFIHGSLDLQTAKVNVESGIYITVENSSVWKIQLFIADFVITCIFCIKKYRLSVRRSFIPFADMGIERRDQCLSSRKNLENKECCIRGFISYIILILINLRSFDPIYFPKWGEIISIEFTNILISSFWF